MAAAIAAGEVVERPASVVKELVENSLDAGATRIVIDLIDGGKSSIRVEDNGSGIHAAELPKAVENFSTSKIKSLEDLFEVKTLGFRGEALSSIRASSILTIRSRSDEEELGRELKFEGREAVMDRPFVRGRGTEVIVERLFFNLPARRKFLRSGAAELRRVIGLIQAYALSFNETAFSLRNDGRDVLFYPASDIEDRVRMVFGQECAGQLARLEKEEGKVRISGFVSKPNLTRSNRYLQFYFVNRRYVRDRILAHAASSAYESLIPRDRFPAIVLFVSLPPESVDVNVHPAKVEVRFRDEAAVHGVVLQAVREAASGKSTSHPRTVASIYGSVAPIWRERESAELFDEKETRRAETIREGVSIRGEEIYGIQESPKPGPVSQISSLYWQLHESYILIQIRGGVVIIDQHAAHERILFDRAKAALSGSRQPVQTLLFPAVVNLSPEAFERYEIMREAIEALGFESEPFGYLSIIVRGIPGGIKNWEDGRLLQAILADGPAGVDNLLKSYSCRAAVKAGTKLSPQEMENLADQLFATDSPYTCPHGRPTMLKMDLSELERRFLRTIRSENE